MEVWYSFGNKGIIFLNDSEGLFALNLNKGPLAPGLIPYKVRSTKENYWETLDLLIFEE